MLPRRSGNRAPDSKEGKMNRGRGFCVLAICAAVAFVSNEAASAAPEKRPNFLIILCDDMGWSDVGCYGGEVDTPNIDSLAAGGLRFTQFYNTAKCFPTRAALLTGLYSHQLGMGDNAGAFGKNSVTLAEAFNEAGYRTLMTGKWHAEETPYKRGFSRHFGLTDGCCNYWNPGIDPLPGQGKPGRKYDRARRWAIDGEEFLPYVPTSADFYTTDAFTDYAIEYVDEYKDEDKPFLLYVAYTAPHYPLHAWPEDIAKYRGKYRVGWDKIREQRYSRQLQMGLFDEDVKLSPRDADVPAWDDLSEDEKDGADLEMAVYAAMIDRMDQNIGRLLDKIRELGEEENTLVMFLADNGASPGNPDKTPGIPAGPVESYRGVGAEWANASNTPFRKFKVWDHEGGICTPCIAYWPRVIGDGGQVTDQVGHVIDIMATCLDAAGADYPDAYNGRPITPMQGKSLLPVFEGKKREGHETLYWQFSKSKAVRQGKWKLVLRQGTPWELYDIDADRTELNDLASAHPERVKELRALYSAWAERVGAKPDP
jgi:arylsulfatase A-like enzyme